MCVNPNVQLAQASAASCWVTAAHSVPDPDPVTHVPQLQQHGELEAAWQLHRQVQQGHVQSRTQSLPASPCEARPCQSRLV